MCIDPPFGKTQTFEGELTVPLEDDERRIEREMMASWDVYDADTAYAKGLEYPDQEGRTARFTDIWSFETRVYEHWWDELKVICPGAYWLIRATRHTHSDSTAAYLAFMVERMLEIRRVLKPTGSIFLHCDHEANAYLRQMMDAVFGKGNFRNEVIWERTTSRNDGKQFGRVHDSILYYSKSAKYTWNPVYLPLNEGGAKAYKYDDDDGKGVYRLDNIANPHPGGYRYDLGFGEKQPKKGYRMTEARAREWLAEGRLVVKKGRVPTKKKYITESKGVKLGSVWHDIRVLSSQASERTGYPTQKPQALAERIIAASTNPGDLVLDCFAGCAYVPVAAQLTGRRWIACDMSPRAWTIVRRQFHKHPRLGIVSEGELPKSETEPDVKLRPQLATANRVIKVRGPDELPERQTAATPRQTTNVRLANLQFKQTPAEPGVNIWNAFVDHWGTQCWYCGRETRRHRQELHLDHIEPNKHDGSNDDCWNRALACTVCNSNKSDKLTTEETIHKALEDGLIQTEYLRDEVLRGFKVRHDWAKLRWETEVKPNRKL